MVAIVTGQGLGVERGSGYVLGSRGQLGDASVGTGGDNVTVNAATGNLNITRVDEIEISANNIDKDAISAYNSQGLGTDPNGDNWMIGNGRTITNVTGTINTAGSTVTRMDWDGSDTVYTYDTASAHYISKPGTGAYDTLTYSSTAGTWTFVDGASQLTEVYTIGVNPNNGADTYWATLTTATNPDGGGIGYQWSGNKITAMYSAGDWVEFTYTGNNLTKVSQYLSPTTTTVTNTYYTYDTQNRLIAISKDITPNDNSITDNNVLSTSYTYVGTTNEIASIAQWAGVAGATGSTQTGYLAFTYDGSGRIKTYTQTISTGVTATTTLTYGTGSTTVSDAYGNVTTLSYDTNDQLTGITYPANSTGAVPSMAFTYDANGNVLSATDGTGNATTYGYDTVGNLLWVRSPTGDETVYTYDSGNRVLTKSVYTGRDPDAGGTGSSPTAPDTTRYAYDSGGHLNYEVSALGEVTEYDWNIYNALGTTMVYRDNVYNVSGLAANTAIATSALTSWVAGIANKSTAQRTDMWYDYRGQLMMSYVYSSCNTDGTRNESTPLTITTYTYDQFGNMVMRTLDGKNVESYVYDGLNRLTSATDITGLTTTYAYNDAAATTTVTTGAGLVTVSTFDQIGELLSANVSGTNMPAAVTTHYAYDKLGNLTMAQDADGNKSFHLYDADGEKIADVAADGTAVVYTYTKSGLLQSTQRFTAKVSSTVLSTLSTSNAVAATLSSLGLTTDTANDQYEWRVYDTDDKLIQTLDSAGEIVNYVYDGAGELMSTDSYRAAAISTSISTWRTTPPATAYTPTADTTHDELTRTWYDADGRVAGTLDGDNHLTVFTYDTAGELVQKTSYANTATWNATLSTAVASVTLDAVHDQTTHYVYDGRGLMVYAIDANLNVTEYDYDWYTNNLLETIAYSAPIAATANYSQSYVAGQISSLSLKSNAANIESLTLYDTSNRVIQTINGAGDVTNYSYDGASHLTTTTTFTNVVSQSSMNYMETYLPSSPLAPTATATDTATRTFYDAAGRVIGVLDADNHLTAITYDAAGNKIREIAYANTATWNASFATTVASVTADATRDHDVRYFYDADERLQYTLTNLTVTEYRYDGHGQLARTIAYDGQITTTATWTNAYVAGQITAHGLASVATTRTTDEIYDLAGRLAFTIAANGAVTGYSYDGRGEKSSVTQYSTTYAVGASTALFSVMSSWQTTHASDAGNRTSYYNYDSAGNLTVTLDPEGRLTAFAYDYAGRVTLQTRYPTVYTPVADISTLVPGVLPSGVEQTKYSYDVLGRLTYSYDGLNVATQTNYDAHNRVTSTVAAYGTADAATTSFTYDDAGRVLTQTDFAGTTTFTYDGKGNRLTVTDGNSHATTYGYDAANQLVKVTLANGTITNYTNDAFGMPVVTTDALGHVSYSFYNNIGKLAASLDAEGYYTTYTYDSFGDLTQTYHYANKITATITPGVMPTAPTVNAAKDEKTLFTYNGLGEVLTATDAESGVETYTYNAFGQQATYTNKLGGVTTDTYDRRGLLTAQTLTESVYAANGTLEAGAATTNYVYDDFGNQTSMTEAAGLTEARTTSHTYDKDNRLVTTTGPAALAYSQSTFASAGTLSAVTTYKYDNRGNLIEQDDGLGNRTLIYYDTANRKIASLNALGYLTTWTLDNVGNVLTEKVYGTTITLPGTPGGAAPTNSSTNVRETDYTYTSIDQLATTTVPSIQTWQVGGGVPATAAIVLSNTYDAAGNLVMQTDGNLQHVWYFYDKRNDKVGQVDQLAYETAYALDQDGNVLTETRYATVVTAPSSSITQYTAAPPALPTATTNANDRITNFTYDRMGRRKTEQRMNVAIASLDGSMNLVAPTSGSSTVSYTYNALGEVWTKQEAAGDVTTYTYDNFGRQLTMAGAVFTNVGGASVQDTTAMSYNALNQLVRTVENSSRVTTYAYDGNGNKTAQTDATGFTTSYYYDLLGRQLLTQYTRQNSAGTNITEAQRLTYDALGRVVQQDSATLSGSTWTAGDVTHIQYDAWGDITGKGVNSITVAGTTSTAYQETYTYDLAGRVTRSTDGDGTVKFYLYDRNGNQTAVITSDGTALAGGYSWSTVTEPQLLSLLTAGTGGALGTSALGSVNVAGVVLTFTTYDARGMATLSTMPFRVYSSAAANTLLKAQTYNAFGEIVTQTDVYTTSDPVVPTTTYTYDTLGKVTSTTLPAMNYYDAAGTLHSAVAPVSYDYYDASGRLIATTDANGNTNTRKLLAGSGYDGADPLVTIEKHADGGLFETYYDVNRDAVKKSTNGAIGTGEIDETYTFDAMNRLLSETHPTRAAGSAGNATLYAQTLVDYYTYDGLGRRLKHYNNLYGSTVAETTDYDVEGRVSKTVNMDGYATGYGYVWSLTATSGFSQFGGWTKTTTQYDIGGATLTSDAETDDYFGRILGTAASGFDTYADVYDAAGNLTSNLGTYGESNAVRYTYFNTGQMSGATQGYVDGSMGGGSLVYGDAQEMIQTYAYDSHGNRTLETAEQLIYTSTAHTMADDGSTFYTHTSSYITEENEGATYDLDHHLLTVGENTALTGTTNGIDTMSIAYSYDLNGNIRNMLSTYYLLNNTGAVSGTSSTENYWYKYDAMNRFTVTMGTLSSGVISAGSAGSAISYNYDGTRHTMADATETDTYTYSTDGLLGATAIALVAGGSESATYSYDALNRQTDVTELDASGNTAYHRYSITYDNASLLLGDSVATRPGGTLTTQVSTYSYQGISTWNATTHRYNLTGGYQEGQVTDVKVATTVSGTTTNSETQYSYGFGYGFGAEVKPTAIFYYATAATTSPMATSYSYTMDQVTSIDIEDGKPRTVTFTDDASGEIMKRDEQQHSGSTSNPHEIHYYLNGIQVGDISNNGTSDTDYAASITQQETAQSTSGTFRNGTNSATPYANFDQSYDPLNGYSSEAGTSSYTVATGDTLQSIALAVWGDSSLWYVIADANGLSAGDTLTSGMSILIPNKVENVSNNSTTFKPTDPNAIIGNVSPTIPKQNHAKCGVLGQILMAVIAIVVSIVTLNPLTGFLVDTLGMGALGAAVVAGGLAAAAGSIVSQGVGMALGIQKSFNWGEVGMAAIGGMVGGGLGPVGDDPGAFSSLGTFGAAAARGVVGSIVSQGVGVATGLQKKFDWAGVAAAGLGAGVTAEVTSALSTDDSVQQASKGPVPQGSTPMAVPPSFTARLGGSIAGMLVDAAARTIIKGTDFGDNIIAALPDALGNTIGGEIGEALMSDGVQSSSESMQERSQMSSVQAQIQQSDADDGGSFQNAAYVTDGSDGPADQVSLVKVTRARRMEDVVGYSNLSPNDLQQLQQSGVDDDRIDAINALLANQASAGIQSPTDSLQNKGIDRVLKLMAGDDQTYDQYSSLNSRLRNALIDTDSEVISVRSQIAAATLSADGTTLTGLSLDDRDYQLAAGLGIWSLVHGSNDIPGAITDDKGVKTAAADANRYAAKDATDVQAQDNVAKFMYDIAEPTNEARLGGDGQHFEKVVVVDHDDDGDLQVATIRAGGSQGSHIIELIGSDTAAVFHIHYEGGVGLEQTPNSGDHSTIKFRDVPDFVYGGQTHQLNEVYRLNNQYYYAGVGPNGTLGTPHTYIIPKT